MEDAGSTMRDEWCTGCATRAARGEEASLPPDARRCKTAHLQQIPPARVVSTWCPSSFYTHLLVYYCIPSLFDSTPQMLKVQPALNPCNQIAAFRGGPWLCGTSLALALQFLVLMCTNLFSGFDYIGLLPLLATLFAYGLFMGLVNWGVWVSQQCWEALLQSAMLCVSWWAMHCSCESRAWIQTSCLPISSLCRFAGSSRGVMYLVSDGKTTPVPVATKRLDDRKVFPFQATERQNEIGIL